MQLTNKAGLPDPIVRAVLNDKYSKGAADFSVTELLQPPQLRWLRLKHSATLTEDVSDRIWSLLGKSTHNVLEDAYEGQADVIVEKRYFARFADKVVSGQVDVLVRGALWDWKVTSVYTVTGGGRDEWVAQLNMLRLLAQRNGETVDELCVAAILRDWQQWRAGIEEDYPSTQIVVLPIPMWTTAETEAFIEERIRLHCMERPDECNDADRWYKPGKYAVMRQNRKTAVRVFDDPEEATEFMAGGSPDMYLQSRPGENRRCARYCPVASVCPQWARLSLPF